MEGVGGAVRAAVVDDNNSVRASIQQWLAHTPDVRCIGSYSNGAAALALLPALRPDVVLMDIRMPGMSGIDCTKGLLQRCPAARVIILSGHLTDELIAESLIAGASGCLLKPVTEQELVMALRKAAKGHTVFSDAAADAVARLVRSAAASSFVPSLGLTLREHEVLVRMAQGLRYKQIGESLGIAARTVEKHAAAAFRKLHVTRRVQAVARYFHREPGR
jgi:DNA-binding NarL/FixJ family response regulator